MRRHAEAHISETLTKAQQAQEVTRGDNLLGQVRAQQAKAEGLYAEAAKILRRAQRQHDPDTALEAIRTAAATLKETRSYLELLGRLAGELQQNTVNVAVIGSEGGGQLRAKLEALIAGARARLPAEEAPPSIEVTAELVPPEPTP